MKKALLSTLLLTSCGIKANPEVLKPPEVQVKRIGKVVYVRSLSGEIRVNDFQKRGPYWVKEEEKGFCFSVQRIGGKTKQFCVEGLVAGEPQLTLEEREDSVTLTAQGFEKYALYPTREGEMLFVQRKEFLSQVRIDRDYWKRCYAVTGLERLSESVPVHFCLEPKPPPPIEEVKNLEVRVGKEKLYLVWSYDADYSEFVILIDNFEVGRTKGLSFELPMLREGSQVIVKVVSPMGFESRGASVVYSP